MDVWSQAARDADLTICLPGDAPMFFRRIRAGSFLMGSRGYADAEEPRHRVRIASDFYLGTFVVTQEQYQAVAARCPALKENPESSHFKGERRPVEQVSWHDAAAFCQWLKESKHLPKGIADVRLPSEAEWEYACRGQTMPEHQSETEYYTGEGEAAVRDVSWYAGTSDGTTHPVDELKEEHPLGLHGMHGNVWEWCADVWDAQAYRKREDGWIARGWTIDEAGDEAENWTSEGCDEKNARRVLRGGSWFDSAGLCRAAYRDGYWPGVRYWIVGFRVCLVPGPESDGRGAPAAASMGAEPAPGDGGRGASPESEGAGGAGRAARRKRSPRSGGK